MSAPLSLAYSPCPNDTYIFAAWTNGLLPDAPPVEVVLDDVEALNEAARQGRYALTKASYGAIPHFGDRYRLLRAGGALGRGCGPLVVAKPGANGEIPSLQELGRSARYAIPGTLTTAYLLLRLALGGRTVTRAMRFDTIVDAVAQGEVDAGLIIHESRFTYQRAGLACVADLGAWWEQSTGHPIPLGAILARRDIDESLSAQVEETIQRSLAFARAYPEKILPYVREHAFEMEESVMWAHIGLYVNEYSHDLGPEGTAAVAGAVAACCRRLLHMKILVVCALAAELPGFTDDDEVRVLSCGLGLVEAASASARALAQTPYTAVISAGIGGAFRGCARVGEACILETESLADFGWEDGTTPALPDGAQLVQRVQAAPKLIEAARALPYRVVHGLTVTRVTTSDATAQRLRTAYEAEVESMEGFGVLRAALLAGVPAIEVRGISNIVGDRARGEWDFRAGSRAAVDALRGLIARLLAH